MGLRKGFVSTFFNIFKAEPRLPSIIDVQKSRLNILKYEVSTLSEPRTLNFGMLCNRFSFIRSFDTTIEYVGKKLLTIG
jgi:hypothetical protein